MFEQELAGTVGKIRKIQDYSLACLNGTEFNKADKIVGRQVYLK